MSVLLTLQLEASVRNIFSVSGNDNFSNTINYLATQMNNKTSFKQHNKERFIIVAGERSESEKVSLVSMLVLGL